MATRQQASQRTSGRGPLTIGATPNLMRNLANSLAVLGAYVNFYTALASGLLDKKLHDQIAIVVAEANSCSGQHLYQLLQQHQPNLVGRSRLAALQLRDGPNGQAAFSGASPGPKNS